MLESHAPSLLVLALAAMGLMACQPATTTSTPSATAPATPLLPAPPLPSPPAPPPTAAPEAPSSAAPPLADQDRTCPALPAARPSDLVIGVSHHIVPIGTDIKNYRAELSENESTCRANLAPGTTRTYTCILVPPAELDDLWSEFRKRSFTTLRSHETPSLSPHYGSRSLWLRWEGRHACEVYDSPQNRIDPGDERTFFDLIHAVEAVGRKHL